MTKRKTAHLWKPGQSGNPNGRPPGANQRLSEDFVEALLKDFSQNGDSAIEACRVEKPEVYLTVISRVLPKEVNIKSDGSEAFVKIWDAIANGLASRVAQEQGQPEDEPPQLN